MSFQPPGYCPNCGEFVEAGQKACGECGSCSETGWNEDSVYDGIELPEEGGHGLKESRMLGTLVGLALLALLLFVFVFR